MTPEEIRDYVVCMNCKAQGLLDHQLCLECRRWIALTNMLSDAIERMEWISSNIADVESAINRQGFA